MSIDPSQMSRILKHLIAIEEGKRSPDTWQNYHSIIRQLIQTSFFIEGGTVTVLWSTIKPRLATLLRYGYNNKIPAIKLFRNMTGAGLKEAKDVVEALMATDPKQWDNVIAKFYKIPSPAFSLEEKSGFMPGSKAIMRTISSQTKKKPRLRHRQKPKSKKSKV